MIFEPWCYYRIFTNINSDIYNALTIHANVYLYENAGKPNEGFNMLSQLDGKFWSRMAYLIGTEGYSFSLDDIEHGILRG